MTWTLLGSQLRALRTLAGLTQQQVAEKAELNHTFISHLEKGIRNPTLDSLKAVCDALNARLSVQVFGAESESRTIDLSGLGEEEQALAIKTVETLRGLRQGQQHRLGMRQLERWIEDFGTAQQAQAIVEELPTVVSRPRRGEEEKPALVAGAGAARPVVRRQPA